MIYTVTLNPAVDREYQVARLDFDEVLRASGVRNDPGGKGFNVSRMIARLGGESTAVGLVGGTSGRWLQQQLAALQIGTSFIEVSGETRTNTTVVARDGGRYLKVNENGPPVSPADEERLTALVAGLAQPGEWWVLAGSLPHGCRPEIYASLTTLLHQAGCLVFLDSSGEPLRLGCLAGPDWIKPNLAEALEITGQKDALAAGRALREMGINHVIISQGSEGALYFSAGETVQIVPPPIVEQNPIGAGDALVGGVVHQLARGANPVDALRWGVACGAAAASLMGTAFGEPKLIQSLVKKAQIIAVNAAGQKNRQPD